MGKGTSTLWMYVVSAVRVMPLETAIIERAGICAFDTQEEAQRHAEALLRENLQGVEGGSEYTIQRARVKPVDMALLRRQLEACGWNMLGNGLAETS